MKTPTALLAAVLIPVAAAAGAQITELKGEQFAQATAQGAVLVDVYMERCGPCRKVEAVLQRIRGEYPHVAFYRIDGPAFGIGSSYPTVMLFQDGKAVAEWTGFNGEGHVRQELAELAKPAAAATKPPVTPIGGGFVVQRSFAAKEAQRKSVATAERLAEELVCEGGSCRLPTIPVVEKKAAKTFSVRYDARPRRTAARTTRNGESEYLGLDAQGAVVRYGGRDAAGADVWLPETGAKVLYLDASGTLRDERGAAVGSFAPQARDTGGVFFNGSGVISLNGGARLMYFGTGDVQPYGRPDAPSERVLIVKR